MFSLDKSNKKESRKNDVVASSKVFPAETSTPQQPSAPHISEIEIHEAGDGNYYPAVSAISVPD